MTTCDCNTNWKAIVALFIIYAAIFSAGCYLYFR